MARFKLKQGDVFTIPLANNVVGYGQIVVFPHTKDVFIICLFDYKAINGPIHKLEIICRSTIIFLGYSTDAKLYHKDWTIVGNFIENLSEIQLPYYKLGIPPNDSYIVNFKGERLKKINEEVFSQLHYQTSYAPIRYENALKAFYKLVEWKSDDYDKLLYEQTLRSIKIATKILPNL